MNSVPTEDRVLPSTRNDRVGWAYQVAQQTDRARERFDAWAEDYDRDVADLLGWRGPEETLRFVLKYVDRSSKILDAGSGTGLMGALLRDAGYQNLVATDISQKMLEVAKAKGIYDQDFQADLTRALPVEDQSFDCVIAVGVSGYMIADTIGDFVRVLRPNGTMIFTISDAHFEEHGFRDVVDDLIRDGVLEQIECAEEFTPLPKSDPSHMARVHVYRKR